MNADDVRAALERFMKARGLYAKEWARKSGVAETAISNFLNHHSNGLQFKTLSKLAEQQKVPVGVLTGELPYPLEQPETGRNPQNQDVLLSPQNLTEDDVKNLQLMVRRLGEIREELAQINEHQQLVAELLKRLIRSMDKPTGERFKAKQPADRST